MTSDIPNSKKSNQGGDYNEAPKTGEQLDHYIEWWTRELDEDERNDPLVEWTVDFHKELIGRLGDGEITPEEYVDTSSRLFIDCMNDTSSFPDRPIPCSLVGHSHEIYATFLIVGEDFAREAFSDQFADRVRELYHEAFQKSFEETGLKTVIDTIAQDISSQQYPEDYHLN